MNELVRIEKLKLWSSDILHFFQGLVREFIALGCQKNAAALTYMTLFALVPMMTVVYSILSVIPFFDGVAHELHDMVFANFLPETGDQVTGYLTEFSSQARSLTGAGIGMLFVTAYLMLTNIEKTFNAIWGVTEARKGLSSFLLYWAVLTIGPLMLGVGLTMSTYLLSLKFLVDEYDPTGLAPTIFTHVPFLMSMIMFTLLYAAVPNCRVPFKFAFAGGVVTSLVFGLLKAGFAAVMSTSSLTLVYGAFAAVPLFLMWINFVWVLVLAGAVFVRTLSEEAYGSRRQRLTDMQALLHCLHLFYERAQTGADVVDKDCTSLGMGLVHWQTLRSKLVKAKWVSVTESGAYVLSRDMQSLSLKDVALLCELPLCETLPMDSELKPWLADFSSRFAQLQQKTDDVFSLSLDRLFSLQKKEGL
ncbi:YihY family inner membrane protein [Agaribacterium sp. ZY112]|uniref:YihY family inner membrane protein n=1 Tax=Agaribacterium sp. ZY112 TaxID=3233574 RepID=UPI003524C480